MFDARGWMTWLLATATLTMITRNPLYLLLILIVARVVNAVCARTTAVLNLPLLRIGMFILLFSSLFNMLSVHVGETTLWRLPASWPWIGGPLTLEAAIYGVINGLVLLTLLVIFTTFNNIVPTGELVRLAPQALRDLAVVVLIAITYLPETTRQLRRIREAQAIRGHRLRGLRDWPPLVLPLLIGGLERAMSIAEAMVSRGYGSTTDSKQPIGVQALLFLGLGSVFAGWSLSFWYGGVGWLIMGVGVLAIFLLLRRLGRRNPTTQYQARPMTVWNAGLMATAVIAAGLLLWRPPIFDFYSLQYTPYPRITLAPLQLSIALILLLPLYPVVVTLIGDKESVAAVSPSSIPPTPTLSQKDNEHDFHT